MNREGDHEQPRRKERRRLPAGRLPLPENEAKDHGARRFFVIGLRAERKGDLTTAKLDYKFALDLDPGSDLDLLIALCDRMLEIERQMAAIARVGQLTANERNLAMARDVLHMLEREWAEIQAARQGESESA